MGQTAISHSEVMPVRVAWGVTMPKVIALMFVALFVGAIAFRASRPSPASAATVNPASRAQFTSDGKLVRPEGYRRWVYISSGFGMSYNPDAGGNGAPAFTNVFVAP